MSCFISRISPTYKKGTKTKKLMIINPPTFILSNFAKVYENFLFHHIHEQITPFIPAHHHGLVRRQSTVVLLIVLTTAFYLRNCPVLALMFRCYN